MWVLEPEAAAGYNGDRVLFIVDAREVRDLDTAKRRMLCEQRGEWNDMGRCAPWSQRMSRRRGFRRAACRT